MVISVIVRQYFIKHHFRGNSVWIPRESDSEEREGPHHSAGVCGQYRVLLPHIHQPSILGSSSSNTRAG